MNLNKLSRVLHITNRTVRDVNAVKRGKVAGRVTNRVVGRQLSDLMRGVWFK